MKRILAALLIVVALLLPTTLALDIEGGGWWEEYNGNTYDISGTGLSFKLPSGWVMDYAYDGEPYFHNANDSMELMIYVSHDQNLSDIQDYVYGEGMACMSIILQQNRDWFVYQGLAGEFEAVCCGEYGGIVNMTFTVTASGVNSFDDARRIVGSVRS